MLEASTSGAKFLLESSSQEYSSNTQKHVSIRFEACFNHTQCFAKGRHRASLTWIAFHQAGLFHLHIHQQLRRYWDDCI